MEWVDEGIILGVRRHGEGSVILEAMTRGHGRHLGVVRGGRSARNHSLLQPGNSVSLVWRARLDEHLGTYQVEGLVLRAARYMASALALNLISTASSLVRLLPERDPHPALYEQLGLLAEQLGDSDGCAGAGLGNAVEPTLRSNSVVAWAVLAPALMVRFELAILAELGFGLDLEQCAATGRSEDLIYVSPRSGRAVSAGAGAPYADRLFALPGFLVRGFSGEPPLRADVLDGFALTGFFLDRHVFEPRGIAAPDSRARVVDMVRAGDALHHG